MQPLYLKDIGSNVEESVANPFKFRVLKVLDYEKKGEEKKKSIPVIIFLTPGSHGHFFQIPPMLNSFYNHTLYLSKKYDVIYELHAFAFDFREMPSVFSRVMIDA